MNQAFLSPKEVFSQETPICLLCSKLHVAQPSGARPTLLSGHAHEAASSLEESSGCLSRTELATLHILRGCVAADDHRSSFV